MLDRAIEEDADGVTFVQLCPMCHKEVRFVPGDHELYELTYRQLWDTALADHFDECTGIIATAGAMGHLYVGEGVVISETFASNPDYGIDIPVLARVSAADAAVRVEMEVEAMAKRLDSLKKAESILKGMTT